MYESKDLSKWIKKFKLIGVCALLLLLSYVVAAVNGKTNPQVLVEFANNKTLLCILIILMLYIFKSISIIIPIASLYLIGGYIFPKGLALIVGTLGDLITLTVPYLMGKWVGRDGISFLEEKYEKVNKIMAYQNRNVAMVSFISRLVGIIPGDILSLYFGTCNAPYGKYIIGGLLGGSLSLITLTLMGEEITNPTSPVFISLLFLRCVIIVGSIAISIKIDRKNQNSK